MKPPSDLGERAASLLGEYIRINTTNPPGNEAQAADFFAQQLRQRGLEPRVYPTAPRRANVVARLKGRGDGSRGALLLLHHMDVVTADAADWVHDPFGGELEDGYVYGRGALDMKCFGIMHLMALDMLLEQGMPLDRDIIFLAVADEEQEGEFGAGWMVENHWEEIAPEIVWDEGGYGIRGLLKDELVFYVSVAEKNGLWTRLIASGEAGLGSIPRGNNPIDVLTQALHKLQEHPFPPRLTPTSAEMLRRLGSTAGFPQSFLLQHAANPLLWPLVSRALAGMPTLNAMVRNLATPTVLRGGEKENIIPARAEAMLDVRLLPDEDPARFFAELEALLADDRLRLETPADLTMPAVTPFDHSFFAGLEAGITSLVPDCQVAPMLTPGGTDSRYFRRKGVPAFGLIPIIIDPDELERMHGIDERISVENLALGSRVVADVVGRVCKSTPS
jgi:acetylornithine deacetylase/succinyl-diaminopimelate desuccinylase-like protein